MIERFYSGDYPGKFEAVCDELNLPFWNVSAWYQTKDARPFVLYDDKYGTTRVAVGKKGWTHNDVFGDMIDLGIKRQDTLCGRIWNFSNVKILTVWDDSSVRFLNSSVFRQLADLMSEKGFEILDFPSDQFDNQAPGTAEEIKDFCVGKFGVTFPQFKKEVSKISK